MQPCQVWVPRPMVISLTSKLRKYLPFILHTWQEVYCTLLLICIGMFWNHRARLGISFHRWQYGRKRGEMWQSWDQDPVFLVSLPPVLLIMYCIPALVLYMCVIHTYIHTQIYTYMQMMLFLSVVVSCWRSYLTGSLWSLKCKALSVEPGPDQVLSCQPLL